MHGQQNLQTSRVRIFTGQFYGHYKKSLEVHWKWENVESAVLHVNYVIGNYVKQQWKS